MSHTRLEPPSLPSCRVAPTVNRIADCLRFAALEASRRLGGNVLNCRMFSVVNLSLSSRSAHDAWIGQLAFENRALVASATLLTFDVSPGACAHLSP